MCALVYHQACADKAGHCLREQCLNRRPSHTSWTREARAKGLWLLLQSPPVPPRLKLLMSLLVLPVAMVGANPFMVCFIGGALIPAFPDLPPWAVFSASVAFISVPSIAMCLALWHQYAQYRPALLDERGALLGHTTKWSGTRVRWEDMLGYKVRPRGLELVLKGRPWTRHALAPLLPCEGRLQHDVTVLLEARGVVNAEG